jgi:hypothetical protein
MGFNTDRFEQTTFSAREATVELPELAGFFDDGEPPRFRVRGLEGEEMARVFTAVKTNADLAGMVEAIAAGEAAEKIAALRQSLGIGDKVPDEVAKRIEQLVIGSVEPKLPRSVVVKLCRVYPVEFWQLTNKIAELTGLGSVPGEPASSTPTPP